MRFLLALLLTFGVTSAWSQGPPTAADSGPDGIQRLTILLEDDYKPGHVVVRPGHPVELVLTSVTRITPHNFIIDDPSAGFQVHQEVGAGKTVTVRFTPPHPGSFIFYCDKKLPFMKSHREKGMEGRLDVR